MKIQNFLLPALFLGVMATLFHRLFSGGPAAPKPAPGSRDPYAPVDAYVESELRRLKIPGAALAIVSGNRIAHLRGFGRARPGGPAPGPQTPFMIGSLTKSFTALAVMQLVEAGKLELDAPVQRYLPWFRVADTQASAEITVRHLLNQTGGFSTAGGSIPLADFDDRPGAVERRARALSSFKLSHPVGSAFEYSNTNYDLLGLIVEAVTGERYAGYVQKHIFDPLEMRHSHTSPADARRDGLAVGHRFRFWNPIPVPNLPVPAGSLASGQLISCAGDMARYLIAHLNGGCCNGVQILSPAGIAELHRGAAEQTALGEVVGQYAMGWLVTGSGPARTIWHTGIVPDFSAYMALLPEQGKGVVLLLNAGHFMMEPILSETGAGLASVLSGREPDPGSFGWVRSLPWVMRLLPLIPLLQIADLVAALRRLRGWQQDPGSRPNAGRAWRRHILPSLVPNLLLVPFLVPVLSPVGGFVKVFMPDFSLIALFSGSFAGLWAFLRPALILRALRKGA